MKVNAETMTGVALVVAAAVFGTAAVVTDNVQAMVACATVAVFGIVFAWLGYQA